MEVKKLHPDEYRGVTVKMLQAPGTAGSWGIEQKWSPAGFFEIKAVLLFYLLLWFLVRKYTLHNFEVCFYSFRFRVLKG